MNILPRILMCSAAAATVLLAACCPGHAWAQVQAAQGQAPTRPVELAITFDALRGNAVSTGNSLFLEGGAAELSIPVYRRLAVVASVMGVAARSSSGAAGLDLVTILFGPHYTFTAPKGRVSVFAEALAGEANGFHGVFALGSGPISNPNNGTTDSANSLALQAGGGLDLHLTPRISVRVIQADYLRTQLPNGGTDAQNNLRLGAGIVMRIGRVTR
jgi:hypothetical protein